MKNRLFFAVFLLLAAGYSASGQKIKYKELFVLLQAKDYDSAEPFLKRYLKANDDNPNAYLYMAIIYETKGLKQDILRQTDQYVMFLDSAVHFYALAGKGMTEKEVSRNDEYYQMDSRRDVRTGEFGVKLSDVVLRIETGMKLSERGKAARRLKAQFVATERSYNHAAALFTTFQRNFSNQKQLYLQANDSVVSQLNRLASIMDSCHVHFSDYKATSKAMGRTGYNQDFNPQDIADFKRELTPADFYADDIKIHDFKRWALRATEIIEKEIKPLKDQLVARDMEINHLHQRLRKDSVSIRTELIALRAKGFPELVKIDPSPLPLQIFLMKEAELDFGSQVAENRVLRDSASLATQIEGIHKEIRYARKLDSIASNLIERNLEDESANYQHFVKTAFGAPSYLKTLIRSTKELALREIIHREAAIKRKTDALRWIINGSDSIPLFIEVSDKSRFKPLVLVQEKYTLGLQFADSVGTGYFFSIEPSRKLGINASYRVNKEAFKKRLLSVTKALSAQDQQGMVYFILTYQEAKFKDKYQATLTKIYKVEGLAWSVDVTFDQVPAEMTFSVESSEVSIKTKSSIGELFITTFNRDGKPMK